MVDVRFVIVSWFMRLKDDKYVLIRIQSLVALVTVMFLVLFILDIFRCHSGKSTITKIMKTVDGVSDQIVVYIIGAMQSADFDNDLFPVWAIVLVSLRASLGYLSGYSIVDRGRRITEVGNVVKFVGVGMLSSTRKLKFTKPLWSLWAILIFRSVCKFVAHSFAIKSLWHGQSSEFLPEYLHLEQQREQLEQREQQGQREQQEQQEQREQQGQREQQEQQEQREQQERIDRKKFYLVYGEANQKINILKPRYVLQLHVTNQNSLTTLYNIHESSEPLLESTNSCRYKDMGLAFTLSRMLRCRLEDVPLHVGSIKMTRKLIISEIIKEKQSMPDEAFRILELELAFVRDYFYTLYPVVFCRGLLSLSFSILQSIATFVITLWLAVGIRKVYKPRDGNYVILVNGRNVDVLITWVFMFFVMFKEIWEMVTYLLSNWTRLLLVCKYVQNKVCPISIISSFFDSKIADPWHGNINQCEFVHSCTYKATFWKLAHTVSLGKTPKKFDGRKAGDSIKVPKPVKEKILKKLEERLQPDIPSLKDSSNRVPRYKPDSLIMLHTYSQAILVWHITTSLCEIKLARDKGVDLSKPGFLNSIWSYLKKKACCSSQQFLLDGKFRQEDTLEYNYQIATSLSRYCAHLLVFKSELLPDSFMVPDVMLEKTLQFACKELEDCDSTLCRYAKLMALTQGDVQDSEAGNLNIVQQGVKLAQILIGNDEECWETLADVWTDLIIDIAPSWNAEAHKQNLEFGGESII